MIPSRIRMVESLFIQLEVLLIEINKIADSKSTKDIKNDYFQKYIKNNFIIVMVWSLSGDLTLREREIFYEKITQMESFSRSGFSNPA